MSHPKIRHYTLPYPPSVNHMYEHGGRGVRLTPEAKQFRKDAGWLVKSQGSEVCYVPIRVVLVFYKPRREGDIDNPLKATLDAMNHILWDDDKLIEELDIKLKMDVDNPRVELWVEEL